MSIISISGKIGSGKDTVGRIIQYLTSTRTYEKSFIEWEEITKTTERHYAGYSSFKIHKWADALKQFIADSTGCTREQLEDREFKEKELGEEWWYYKSSIFRDLPYLEHKNNVNASYTLIKPTPRLLFTSVGTDAIRNHVHSNYWVNCLMSKYKEYKYAEAANGLVTDKPVYKYPNWVITDTRFPNELKAVKNKGGISIKVNRIPTVTINNVKFFVGTDGLPEHPSETALDNAEFDYVIDNNSSIIELIGKVREILIKENFIK